MKKCWVWRKRAGRKSRENEMDAHPINLLLPTTAIKKHKCSKNHPEETPDDVTSSAALCHIHHSHHHLRRLLASHSSHQDSQSSHACSWPGPVLDVGKNLLLPNAPSEEAAAADVMMGWRPMICTSEFPCGKKSGPRPGFRGHASVLDHKVAKEESVGKHVPAAPRWH